jgi:hypothetical protein
MTVDELLKIVVVVGVTFSIVGISWQIMRLISKLADTVQDTRRVVQNVGEVSDLAVEDYKSVRGIVKSVGNIGAAFEGITKLMGRFSGRGKTKPTPHRTTTTMIDE